MNTSPEPTGAAETFRAVYAATYDDVLRYVQRRLRPVSGAEDVVADAMTTVWRRIDDLPPNPAEHRPWVFGIARNCLLNAVRASRRSEAVGVELTDPHALTGAVPDTADAVAARLDVAAAWDHLTEDEQDVLALTILDGLTSTEAAAVLGTTPNAYRLRLSRARAQLRRSLQGAASHADATAKENAS